MDETRNARAYAQSVFECSGQPYDPDLHAACSQTCRNLLKDVESEALEGVLAKLAGHMVRSKRFEEARLWGCLCVAVDGTLCERKRGSGLSEREKRRYALEARIVTPWGWNVPVALALAAWGRRRWNVENGFRVEKHDGFGLGHTFCNDDAAGRNYHILMQVAYALWQVFAHGMLRRIGAGCRKMTQTGWARLLASARRLVGLRPFPAALVGVMRMRRQRLAG